MSRILRGITGFNTFGIVFLAVVLIAVGVFERPWLTYPDLPFKLLDHKSVYYPGQPIPLDLVRCNNTHEEQTYLLTHKLTNDDTQEITYLPGTQIEIAPGCTSNDKKETSRVNVLPVTTKPGHYHFSGYGMVNGTIRTFKVYWFSESFEVRALPGQ